MVQSHREEIQQRNQVSRDVDGIHKLKHAGGGQSFGHFIDGGRNDRGDQDFDKDVHEDAEGDENVGGGQTDDKLGVVGQSVRNVGRGADGSHIHGQSQEAQNEADDVFRLFEDVVCPLVNVLRLQVGPGRGVDDVEEFGVEAARVDIVRDYGGVKHWWQFGKIKRK